MTGGETDQVNIEEETEITKEISEKKLKDRKVSWAKLRRVDSLNLEAGRVSMNANHHSKVLYIFHIFIHFYVIY
jgi:KUP system potassium uptake protein